MTVSPDSSTHVIEAYTVGVIVALLSNINTIKLNAIFKFNMEKLDNIFAISYTNMRNLRYNFTEVGVPPVWSWDVDYVYWLHIILMSSLASCSCPKLAMVIISHWRNRNCGLHPPNN